jgi:formate hydrogenlyase subunit 3/multisubunit Na+/H+ antiporter MnhD subunit
MLFILAVLVAIYLIILAMPEKSRPLLMGFFIIVFAAFTSWIAIYSLFTGNVIEYFTGQTRLTVDQLSAIFILLINFTFISQLFYSKGYLQGYIENKSSFKASLHYTNIIYAYISMLLVVSVRSSLEFLIFWEILSLSTFILVLFDGENEKIRRSAINYLFQMHLGMFLILAGFVITSNISSSGFEAVKIYFNVHKAWPVFLLFFIGFGLKAGFLGMHTWLPDAHPSAPSHVSALMSGIIIKMGIYGILRVTSFLPENSLVIGIIVLLFSSVTGLYGVMQAIIQHDIKRLLAFHSIENIGIIGMGVGVGIIGKSTGNDFLTYMGFGGAILHTINHALFKSLLFYGAGAVVKATHTRNIENMGGLLKIMPRTGIFFLIGSLAICGLPPFNGFISEFLIYSGLFRSLHNQSLLIIITALLAILSLALIGGFAIFCFTKVFGIVFLGSARSEHTSTETHSNVFMDIGQLLPALLIITIGLLPSLFVKIIYASVKQTYSVNAIDSSSLYIMQYISTGAFFFILVTLLLTGLRYLLIKLRAYKKGPTWGCGYDALTPKHQYTATSYTQEYQKLYGPMLGFRYRRYKIAGNEIFPAARHFATHIPEKISTFFSWLFIKAACLFRKTAVLQTGHLQHYALYLLLYLILLLLLTIFNVI